MNHKTDRLEAERLDGARDIAAESGEAAQVRAEAGDESPATKAQSAPSWVGEFLSRYALILGWFVMAGIYLVLMPTKFGSVGTVTSIFGSQQTLVFLAMAALVTLAVGEFDLSIAFVMGITATLIPVVTNQTGRIWVGVLVGLAAAAFCGAVNAFFAVYLGVSSIVVTLGTGTLIGGLSHMFSHGTIVTVFEPAFSNLALTPVFGMPISFYYGIAFVAFLAYVYAYTPLGRHMLFVGSSKEVARLAGIRVEWIRAGSYVAGGLLAGVAGMLLVATQGGFDPASSMTLLLPALAAVFLGTAVIQPGQFNPVGTLVAIYFLATGIFGLQLLGFSGWIQNVFYGAGLVIAVTLANLARNKARTA
ncbi:ABC transporter permease [Streptomyces sp. NPDC001812]|uniref:ABC transporter permease n=1 Tax=Streptomyces cathayae TaxID=3031124 RepID=A0ABY8JYB1_9ACTN|nr:ABC transporter permease [Streptomyces sp. HUAS 5]WGD39656.1 ABC transporter permease [Streptomyces sp. HUAS 5]